MMDINNFSFTLPDELIAQEPLQERHASRLLILDRTTGAIQHSQMSDIQQVLNPGDVLVFNNSKVIPARLYGQKSTGGTVEILLITQHETHKESEIWEVMLRGKNLNPGMTLRITRDALPAINIQILERASDRTWLVEFSGYNNTFMEIVHELGVTPIPPYIHSTLSEAALRERYQTVYATSPGSVAAPTAGLHFTKNLLEQLKSYGVESAFVTLHVGLGTFAPITHTDIAQHVMHEEWAEITAEAAEQINTAKREGRRIIAIGTTTVRTLESFAEQNHLSAGRKKTNIFIQPGYQFQIIDGMLTNFHLPKSTLLLLVSAFAGRESILKAYHEAIERKYRFYSFGDAMIIV